MFAVRLVCWFYDDTYPSFRIDIVCVQTRKMPVQKEQVDGEERAQHEQGVEIMGVRFAPFSLPMQRRLQTAAVCLTICTGPCLLVVDLLVIVYGPWWARYLMLLYLVRDFFEAVQG